MVRLSTSPQRRRPTKSSPETAAAQKFKSRSPVSSPQRKRQACVSQVEVPQTAEVRAADSSSTEVVPTKRTNDQRRALIAFVLLGAAVAAIMLCIQTANEVDEGQEPQEAVPLQKSKGAGLNGDFLKGAFLRTGEFLKGVLGSKPGHQAQKAPHTKTHFLVA